MMRVKFHYIRSRDNRAAIIAPRQPGRDNPVDNPSRQIKFGNLTKVGKLEAVDNSLIRPLYGW